MFVRRNRKRAGKKIYESILLVEGFRIGKKVRHKIIANLSKMPPSLVAAVEAATSGDGHQNATRPPQRAGRNFGGLFALSRVARKLGIEDVLGGSPLGRWALILICGRILTQGSRRHLTFWQKGQAIKEALGTPPFSTDDLYETLDWLDENQSKIESSLFQKNIADKTEKMFLYDITSSYLEGDLNELAAFGYNRDGKKGKKQIVVGLLTSKEGFPISIEVFAGNTSDSTTVPDQVAKLVERFDEREIIFVGDRGMVKSGGIETLAMKPDSGWYITAITKPQIEKMLKTGVFNLEQFTETPTEISSNKIRYVLRRNPKRAVEISQNRQSKIKKVLTLVDAMNKELVVKPRMQPSTALVKAKNLIEKLKIVQILIPILNDRLLTVDIDPVAMAEASKLDGCYVVKTNLDPSQSDTEATHTSYKNLKFVEWAFRTMKSSFLELRPIFHRKANRTRALALVAMLAYMIIFEIWRLCRQLNVPLEEIVAALDQIQTVELQIGGHWITTLPSVLREDQAQYMTALELKLPATL